MLVSELKSALVSIGLQGLPYQSTKIKQNNTKQTPERLQQQKCIASQFWGREVQSQDVREGSVPDLSSRLVDSSQLLPVSLHIRLLCTC